MTECVDCAFCAPLTDAERDQIFQALLEIVGPRGLVTAPDEIAAASLDSRRRRQGSALALVRAASTEEVSALCAWLENGDSASCRNAATLQPWAAQHRNQKALPTAARSFSVSPA